MSTPALIRPLGAALTLVALAALALFLWPTQLGGWTSYAVVSGTSMEPGLSTGDLVLTRARSDYRVGDAVLYESDVLGRQVLHRIVASEGGRYTFRGDNRDRNDPEQLPGSAILGALWVTVPWVGSAVTWLGEPLHLGIATFFLVLVLLAGGREVSRRRRAVDPPPIAAEPEPREGGSLVGLARGALTAGALALVAFGALAALAWTRPATEDRTVADAYTHTGTFAYDARARRGAAYPDGKVETGEPVFVRLSRTVDVAFDYRFTSSRPASIRGEVALEATIADGLGWQRTLPLAEAAHFTGPAARVEGRLDLRRLLAILDGVRSSTGQVVSQARVTVVPRVTVTGSAGGAPVDPVFTPALAFTLDPVALRLEQSEPAGAPPAASPLEPRVEGTATVAAPRSLSLGPLALGVERARALSLAGVLAALVALGAAGVVLLRRLAGTEAERIEARYGGRVVRARATVPEGRWVTDLDEVDALVRLAEAYDRVVLHVTEPDGGDAYLVDDGISLYRYRARRPGALGTPRTVPAHGR